MKKDELKQVANVKALVDIDNISNPKAGTFTLSDIKLVAYDVNGDLVDAFSLIVHKDKAYSRGRRMAEKLKEQAGLDCCNCR